MNVLAIGAHPDDIEIGCGGSLIKYSESGHNVYLLIMTAGEMGGDAAIRKNEQMNSAKIIVAKDVFFLDYPDTNLPLNKTLISHIEAVIGKIKPEFVFVNYMHDTHQDHRTLAKGAISATRYIKNVLFYEVPTTHDFNPNIFVDITHVIEKKITSLVAHASQVMKTNIEGLSIIDIARSSALFRGIQGRVKYAEGFVPLRQFLNII
jgi:LmbE family N-acetylglucosaminyl deacetylase